MDTDHMAQILLSLQEGLRYSEVGISTQAVNSLDHLATHWHKKKQSAEQQGGAYFGVSPERQAQDASEAAAIEQQRDVLGGILLSLLSYVLFEDCPNLWSCSRAIFSMMLLVPDVFQMFKRKLIEKQAPESQQRLEGCFERLMSDISEDLESRTRDLFTRQLNIFRTDIKSFVSPDVIL